MCPSLSGQQERNEDRYREPRLTLRPPSQAAPYAPVQNWHHQPEKLIFESCGYEANVRVVEVWPPVYMVTVLVPVDGSLVFPSAHAPLSVRLSFPFAVLGLHADQGAAGHRVHAGRLCQNEGTVKRCYGNTGMAGRIGWEVGGTRERTTCRLGWN